MSALELVKPGNAGSLGFRKGILLGDSHLISGSFLKFWGLERVEAVPLLSQHCGKLARLNTKEG